MENEVEVQWEPNCGHCQACDIHHFVPPENPNDFSSILLAQRMYLCELCGNKRCPHATDHRLECTKSNKPNQPGSSYQQRYFGDEPGAPNHEQKT